MKMVFCLGSSPATPATTATPATLIIFYSPSKVKCCYSEAQ